MSRRSVCFVLCALACLLPAAQGRAEGPYMFGSFGARVISNEDMNAFFAMGDQGTEFVPTELGEAYLTAGYRFTNPFALEVAGGAQQGREASNLYSFGEVDLQVPSGALTLLSVAPVFCFNTFGSAGSTWLNQVGLRLEFAEVSGTETLESSSGEVSTLAFNGSTVGWGLFYRLVDLWTPARLSVGVETGYEYLQFGSLASGAPTGVFVGQSSWKLQNMNGAAAFLDNSGVYVRLVVGWDKDSRIRPRGDSMRASDAPSQDSADRQAARAALLARARTADKEGDKAAALESYRIYLRKYPKDGQAWRDLGDIYEAYGRKDYAQPCFKRAQALQSEMGQ